MLCHLSLQDLPSTNKQVKVLSVWGPRIRWWICEGALPRQTHPSHLGLRANKAACGRRTGFKKADAFPENSVKTNGTILG